jgi:hypothetical protein
MKREATESCYARVNVYNAVKKALKEMAEKIASDKSEALAKSRARTAAAFLENQRVGETEIEGDEMAHLMFRSRLMTTLARVASFLLVAQGAWAQTAATPAPWAGWARCQVDVVGPGYTDRRTHTWTLTGGAPRMEGAFRVFPASWSVVGSGSIDRAQGGQTLTARWAVNGTSTNAPISFWVRASDARLIASSRHGQVVVNGGVAGYAIYANDGKPNPPQQIAAQAQEWTFPTVDDASTSTTLNGTSSTGVAGSVGYMQQPGSQTTVSCTWQFAQGAAVTPPPALAAVAVPAPSLPGGAQSPPLTGGTSQPTGGTVPGTSQPGGTTPTTSGGIVLPGTRPQTPIEVPPTPELTAVPGGTTTGTTGPTAATARDPSNFRAQQTGDGTVRLTWDAVTGAGSYMLGGPGTNNGIMVNGLSQTLTGIPQGTQTWTVATVYSPGGILTTNDRWSRASTTVTNTSGRYRLLVTGFRVNRPTFDERINGNGDEDYVAVGLSTIDRRDSSVIQPWAVIKSDSYGDVGRFPTFVRAGSATPTGGLWVGDVVPMGTDPRTPSGAPSPNRFPLAVWEGTLRDGIDVLIVKPTLWENDGQIETYDRWATLRDRVGNYMQPARIGRVNEQDHAAQAAVISERAGRGEITSFRGTPVFFCSELVPISDNCHGGFDRPIGMDRVGGCIGYDFRTNAVWCDLAVVVTREGIERALSASFQVGGISAGSITIPLIEPVGVDLLTGGYEGSYELYLRVERLP